MALIKCPECGRGISDAAKSCPHCGYPMMQEAQRDTAEPESAQPEETQVVPMRTGRGAGGALMICALIAVILAILSVAMKDNETFAAKQREQAERQTVESQQSEYTEEQRQQLEKEKDLEAIAKSLKEAAVGTYFENSSTTIDEDTITLNVWTEGMAIGAEMTKEQGEADDWLYWSELITYLVKLSKAGKEALEAVGQPDVNIRINMLNDQEKDKVLIKLWNSAVVYNVLE